MFLFFLTTAQVIKAGNEGACDQFEKFPDDRYYWLLCGPKISWENLHTFPESWNIYQRKMTDSLEHWKICIKSPHNTQCEEAFQQNVRSHRKKDLHRNKGFKEKITQIVKNLEIQRQLLSYFTAKQTPGVPVRLCISLLVHLQKTV